jgi:hypothetical protein
VGRWRQEITVYTKVVRSHLKNKNTNKSAEFVVQVLSMWRTLGSILNIKKKKQKTNERKGWAYSCWPMPGMVVLPVIPFLKR